MTPHVGTKNVSNGAKAQQVTGQQGPESKESDGLDQTDVIQAAHNLSKKKKQPKEAFAIAFAAGPTAQLPDKGARRLVHRRPAFENAAATKKAAGDRVPLAVKPNSTPLPAGTTENLDPSSLHIAKSEIVAINPETGHRTAVQKAKNILQNGGRNESMPASFERKNSDRRFFDKTSNISKKTSKKSNVKEGVTHGAAQRVQPMAGAMVLAAAQTPDGPEPATRRTKDQGQDIWISDGGGVSLELMVTGAARTQHAGPQRGVAHDIQVARSVGVQIRQSVAENSGQTFEVTLDPVELGRVKLTLHPTDSGMTVHILADRVETVDLMRRHTTVIQQEFKDMGLQEFSFSFSQNDRHEPTDTGFVSEEEWLVPDAKMTQSAIVPVVSTVGPLGKTTSLDLRL